MSTRIGIRNFELAGYHAVGPLVPATHSLAISVLVYFSCIFCYIKLNETVKYQMLGKMEDKAKLLKNINRIATMLRLHGEESAWGQISGFPMNG